MIEHNAGTEKIGEGAEARKQVSLEDRFRFALHALGDADPDQCEASALAKIFTKTRSALGNEGMRALREQKEIPFGANFFSVGKGIFDGMQKRWHKFERINDQAILLRQVSQFKFAEPKDILRLSDDLRSGAQFLTLRSAYKVSLAMIDAGSLDHKAHEPFLKQAISLLPQNGIIADWSTMDISNAINRVAYIAARITANSELLDAIETAACSNIHSFYLVPGCNVVRSLAVVLRQKFANAFLRECPVHRAEDNEHLNGALLNLFQAFGALGLEKRLPPVLVPLMKNAVENFQATNITRRSPFEKELGRLLERAFAASIEITPQYQECGFFSAYRIKSSSDPHKQLMIECVDSNPIVSPDDVAIWMGQSTPLLKGRYFARQKIPVIRIDREELVGLSDERKEERVSSLVSPELF